MPVEYLLDHKERAVPPINAAGLVTPLLALQFVAFGWRINREIAVGDAGRKTWFPLSDILNIVSLLAVSWACVLLPLRAGIFGEISIRVLAAAYVAIVFHPICMLGHYRLLTKEGRHFYTKAGRDFPYATPAELVLVALSLAMAVLAAWLVA